LVTEQLDGAPHDAAQAPPVYDAVVIDRDTRRLGFLQHRGPDAVEALDVCEQSIGVFENECAAVAAVWRRARGQAVWS
jgi:hypothetical protein